MRLTTWGVPQPTGLQRVVGWFLVSVVFLVVGGALGLVGALTVH